MSSAKEEWFHHFDPRVVVMIVSQQLDMSFHQAPFTWVTPASKSGLVVVMMRTGSKTLAAVTARKTGHDIVTLNILLEEQGLAQKVLETRRPKDPAFFECVPRKSWPVPMLKGSIGSFLCKVRAVIPPPLFGLTSHYMVSLEKTDSFEDKSQDLKPLMFYHSTLFASACNYDVKGY